MTNHLESIEETYPEPSPLLVLIAVGLFQFAFGLAVGLLIAALFGWEPMI